MKTLQKIEWEKCPSVMTGGKKYFYYTRLNNHSWWIVWDKYESAYIFMHELTTFKQFNSLKKAFKYADNFFGINKLPPKYVK